MPKISPFLWFDTQAEEAAKFYVSVFPNSRVVHSSPMVVRFVLDGQEVLALNGGPHFKLTEAFSLFIDCKDQEEVDHYWAKLLEGGGEPSQCGWLKDRFGLSWQVIPRILMDIHTDPDKAKAKRVMDAMMKMGKIDVAALKKAASG